MKPSSLSYQIENFFISEHRNRRSDREEMKKYAYSSLSSSYESDTEMYIFKNFMTPDAFIVIVTSTWNAENEKIKYDFKMIQSDDDKRVDVIPVVEKWIEDMENYINNKPVTPPKLKEPDGPRCWNDCLVYSYKCTCS